MSFRSGYQFGNQPSGGWGKTKAEHIVACREESVAQFGDLPDDRQRIPGHRSPAVPFRLGFTVDRCDKIRSGGITKLLDAMVRDRRVVARELHHRTESQSVVEG